MNAEAPTPDPQDGAERRRLAGLDRAELEARQLGRLNATLEAARGGGLYAQKLAGAAPRLASLAELRGLPLSTKMELQPPPGAEPLATNRTLPLDRYVRRHQTSGTGGRPLGVVDSPEDWRWWVGCWQWVLDAAGVTPADRAVLAFSFGPFIGFWSAFDALVARGAMTIPAGGMSSVARLELLRSVGATAVLCTPTYALHLAETAAREGVDLAALPVDKLIVAGEPGGSLPAVRGRIERAWGARVTDHAGATEVGAWGYGDPSGSGLMVNEAEFVAEFLKADDDAPAVAGEPSRLVLTTLGRHGCPVVRYDTGDVVVCPTPPERGFVYLAGGVVGRADNMLVVRGVNIYPSAIEEALRGFPELGEFRITARKRGALDGLLVEVEDPTGRPERVARELMLRLGLTVEVAAVPAGSLPRTEHKSRRFVDLRGDAPEGAPAGGGPDGENRT